jgi:phosphatidylglycerophosphate synthase
MASLQSRVRFGPADWVTAVRAGFVAVVAALTLAPKTPTIAAVAVACAAIAAILDGVDGWVARRTGTASAFGARFDMEVDALMILVLSVAVWQFGKAGAWILLAGAMRYAFGAAAWVLPWMNGPLTPTRRAKVVKVINDVALCVALAPIVAWPLSAIVAGAGLALLAYSFGVDVRRLWRA